MLITAVTWQHYEKNSYMFYAKTKAQMQSTFEKLPDANEKIRLHASFVLSHQRIWFCYKNYVLPKSDCLSNFKNVSKMVLPL